MTSAALLALVVVLNTAGTTTEETAAILPAESCLASQAAVWQLPADTAGGSPTVDAYCVDPASAPAIGRQVVRHVR